MSVVEVKSEKTWVKDKPRPEGVYDARMGPCTRKIICKTCGGTLNSCPGHFGHIELDAPVFNPNMAQVVLRVLRSVCWQCARPLMLPESEPHGPRARILGMRPGAKKLSEFSKAAQALRVCRLPHICDEDLELFAEDEEPMETVTEDGEGDDGGGEEEGEKGRPPNRKRKAAAAMTNSSAGEKGRAEEAVGDKDEDEDEDEEARRIRRRELELEELLNRRLGKTTGGGDAEQQQQHKALLPAEATLGAVTSGGLRRHAHPGCGCRQPVFVKGGGRISIKPDENQPVDEGYRGLGVPRDAIADVWAIRRLLQRITDADLMTIGLNPKQSRPEWLVPTVVVVPPPCIRPLHTTSGHNRNDDDITGKLRELVRHNKLLHDSLHGIEVSRGDGRRQRSGTTPDRAYEVLQWSFNTLIDNTRSSEYPQATHRKNSRPLKTYRDRVKGKTGRVRGDIQGKRTDQTGRTVATPGADISLGEVGVPIEMCMELTIPERVTPTNREWLEQLVRNGAKQYPGAKNVVKVGPSFPRPVEICLTAPSAEERARMRLEIGWVVKRHLVRGDVVGINRQPTLHRPSLMGHIVVPVPGRTMRINLSACNPYNLDFDGDEINLHVPQGPEQAAELRETMRVAKHVRGPGALAPVMGIVQDSQTSHALLTQPGVLFDREHAVQLFRLADPAAPSVAGTMLPPAVLRAPGSAGPFWTGRQVFSACVPDFVCYERRGASASSVFEADVDDPTFALVTRGELLYGIANKGMIGASNGSIVDIVATDGTGEEVTRLIDSLQAVATAFVAQRGFSVHMGDVLLSERDRKRARTILSKAKDAVERMRAEGETEIHVNQVLNKAREIAGAVADEALLAPENNVVTMIEYGGKGKRPNIHQMAVCVGQQNVEGARVKPGRSGRALPHHVPADIMGMEEGGFCDSSYRDGQGPAEYFFHAMGGREGLNDTAVKTSETGYIERRLVKAAESLRVEYDGSVRDTCGLLEERYGDDGADPQHMVWVAVPGAKLDDAAFADAFLDESRLPEEAARLKRGRAVALRVLTHSRSAKGDVIPTMVDVGRLARDVAAFANKRTRCGVSSEAEEEGIATASSGSSYTWEDAARDVDEAIEKFRPKPQPLTDFMLRAPLAVKRLDALVHREAPADVRAERLRVLVRGVLAKVRRAYARCVCPAGEMVGSLAATSLGERTTQLTLNSFHFVGVSEEREVTMGVPRYKEIIGLAKKPSTPCTTVFLVSPFRDSAANAEVVRRALVALLFRDLVSETVVAQTSAGERGARIWADEDGAPEEMAASAAAREGAAVAASFEALPDCAAPPRGEWSEFGFGLRLNAARLVKEGVVLDEVVERLRLAAPDLVCVPSGWGDGSPTVWCWPTFGRAGPPTHARSERFCRTLAGRICAQTAVRGIAEIRDASIRKLSSRVLDAERGALVSRDEYIIETDGNALAKVLAVDGVDATRTYSNDPAEIAEVLGIQCAWSSIVREMRRIFGLSNFVDYRHIAVFAHIMTRTGHLSSISRFGIAKWHKAPILRATFEESADVLMEAGAHGLNDPIRGVSERVMVGATSEVGTGLVRLGFRPDLLTAESGAVPQSELPCAIASRKRAREAATQAANEARRKRWGVVVPGCGSGEGLLGLGAGPERQTSCWAEVPRVGFVPPEPRWIQFPTRFFPPEPRWIKTFAPPEPRWIRTTSIAAQ